MVYSQPRDFIGYPSDLPLGQPTKRDVLKFIAFTRISLTQTDEGSRTVSHGGDVPNNPDVFNIVAERLLQLYIPHDFQSVTRRSLVR